jgi:hypothetical protein
MCYKQFLEVMSQLHTKKQIHIMHEDIIITIKQIKNNTHWRFSTKISDGQDSIASMVLPGISSTGVWRWQSKGAYLFLDPSSQNIYLGEEVPMTTKSYLFFKRCWDNFICTMEEWQENQNSKIQSRL